MSDLLKSILQRLLEECSSSDHLYSGVHSPMLDRSPSMAPSKSLQQYLATISICLGAFCGGSTLSWSSPALIYLQPQANDTNEDSPYPHFTVTESETALIGSILTMGALASAIPVGYLCDKVGRKITSLSISVIFLASWILITCSQSPEMLMASRFFLGMGLGGICVAAPMYISEIADSSHRGICGSLFQMFFTLGILMSSVFGSFTNWIGLNIALAIPAVMFGVTFLFMPESPVYLVMANKVSQAELTLVRLRGSQFDVAEELKTIQKEVQEGREKALTIKDIIQSKGNIRAIVSVVGVLVFQQLCGVGALVFYTSNIFQAAGSSLSPTLAAVIMNLVQAIVVFVSMFIIEKANRKFFLIISSVGMMLCLMALGMFFHLKLLGIEKHVTFLPLASIVLFMVFFAVGYGPIPWMLMGELLSPEIKGVSSGIAVLFNWIAAFLVTFFFPLMYTTVGGHVTFYVFAGGMAVATLFVLFIVPETRGKSLIEIQALLNC